MAEIRACEAEKEGRRDGERKRGGGVKGVNRYVFDPGRQMLKRSCLLCVKAHLSWQVAVPRWLFVPNPALMSRKKDGKGGEGPWQG